MSTRRAVEQDAETLQVPSDFEPSADLRTGIFRASRKNARPAVQAVTVRLMAAHWGPEMDMSLR